MYLRDIDRLIIIKIIISKNQSFRMQTKVSHMLEKIMIESIHRFLNQDKCFLIKCQW